MNEWKQPDKTQAEAKLNDLTNMIRQALALYVQLEAKRIEHMARALRETEELNNRTTEQHDQ